MKKTNYKLGALKRKLKIHARGKTEPGTLIRQMNAQKVVQKSQDTFKQVSVPERIAIMGAG